ncbi:hypothetical protein J6590_043360 [Homalodisca vitripennis]|nr:hypothetical protein J6590_043360 [Homalodisca vitripennis]
MAARLMCAILHHPVPPAGAYKRLYVTLTTQHCQQKKKVEWVELLLSNSILSLQPTEPRSVREDWVQTMFIDGRLCSGEERVTKDETHFPGNLGREKRTKDKTELPGKLTVREDWVQTMFIDGRFNGGSGPP